MFEFHQEDLDVIRSVSEAVRLDTPLVLAGSPVSGRDTMSVLWAALSEGMHLVEVVTLSQVRRDPSSVMRLDGAFYILVADVEFDLNSPLERHLLSAALVAEFGHGETKRLISLA